MPTKKIVSLFQPSTRFMRSIHLERDFQDLSALNGYVLTEHSRESLMRISEGLRKDSSQRAWRIMGNYGAGKSSFALLLAHWFAGDIRNLPSSIESDISYQKLVSSTPRLVPILITGSRISMTETVCRSLEQTLERLYIGHRKPETVTDILTELRRENFRMSESQLIQALNRANDCIIGDGLGTGLLLIIDELGKFLEFVALHPEQQDVYLLQSLAEIAARSGERPIFVIGLLHQGFQAYAHNLSNVTQREWEKVAARFEQILFDQPLDQLATLISSALNLTPTLLPETTRKKANLAMKNALALGWFGASHAKSILHKNAARIYPLHPTVLPVLTRVFRRFGQNERSLFSFLLSNEPFGLQEFSERPFKANEFFRLHDLYDYVRVNFGYRLSIQSYRSHWNQIDSMIQSYVTDDAVELKILKTVGILNLLDMNDLIATEDIILLSLSGIASSKKSMEAALSRLHSRRRILHYRGAAGGYCLWPYTSVNLELVYENAAKSIPVTIHVADRVSRYVKSTPVVARRHYITTGNLRHFHVSYSPLPEVENTLKNRNNGTDGLIIVPLCETEEERQGALAIAQGKEAIQRQEAIIAVPPPLSNLAGLMAEVERWEWVSRNTPELANDRFAVEEVSRQKRAALTAFNRRLQEFVGLERFHGETSLECYHKGKRLPIHTGRDLLQQLSCICDDVYVHAPRIKNELINRHFLSVAAATARMRLMERMLAYSAVERLGMEETKRPPEMSMYLSVLKAANIHQDTEDGWRITKPSREGDPCNVIPAWECIESILKSRRDKRVPVPDIFDALHNSPYGVRDGLIPIFLAAFIADNQEQIALYEHGTFIPSIESEELLRLSKAPETFDLQFCSVEGIRSELLQRLHSVITGKKEEVEKLAVLDLVKPLCVFVARLPEYARLTMRLHATSMGVRQAILSTRDPFLLLFKELPVACGLLAFENNKSEKTDRETRSYIRKLRRSLSELRMAYSQLLNRIQESMSKVFDLSPAVEEMRNELRARAEKILMNVTESRLKAFCIRLSDNGLRDSEWIESIGSFLVSCPPSKWHDNDEETFAHELSLLASRFQRMEGMVFGGEDARLEAPGMRVTLTRLDGQERDRVLYFRDREEDEIEDIHKRIEELVSKNTRLGIVAASRVLWKKLSENEEL